jgi:hypothetical protein
MTSFWFAPLFAVSGCGVHKCKKKETASQRDPSCGEKTHNNNVSNNHEIMLLWDGHWSRRFPGHIYFGGFCNYSMLYRSRIWSDLWIDLLSLQTKSSIYW